MRNLMPYADNATLIPKEKSRACEKYKIPGGRLAILEPALDTQAGTGIALRIASNAVSTTENISAKHQSTN
jgi:hypothetical protein